MLLRMGEIIAWNMLSWFGIIHKPLLLHLVGCLCYCISDARSYKHQTQDVTMYCVRLFHFNVSSPIIITLSGIKSHVVFAWLADFYLLFIKAVCMKAKRSVPCKIQLMFLLPPLACIIFTKLCHVMYLSIHQLNCRYWAMPVAGRFLWLCLNNVAENNYLTCYG